MLALSLLAAHVDAQGPPPRIDSIEPAHGPTGGGTNVTVVGKHLADVTTVRFGSVEAAFHIHGDERITTIAPAHPASVVDIEIVSGGRSSTVPFEYRAPAPEGGALPGIDAVSPEGAPADGGTEIVIDGSGLGQAQGVFFGAVEAASWTPESDTRIVAVTPPHAAGDVDLRVETPNGSATHPFTFSKTPGPQTDARIPVIDGLDPSRGPVEGATSVTITGRHLSNVTGVTFGGTDAASIHIEDGGRMVAVTPPHDAGDVDVIVSSANGTATARFRYEAPETSEQTQSQTESTTVDGAQPSDGAQNQTESTSVESAEPLQEAPDAHSLGVRADVIEAGLPDARGFGSCWVLLAPNVPGERIVVPFPHECGVEAVVVEVPDAQGLLNVSVAPLADLPAGVPSPEMPTGPGLIFEAVIRDLEGHEIQPEGAILQVRLPGAWLEQCPPEDCATTLFHYHNRTWATHGMRTIDIASGSVVMQADVTSFSLFVVGGTPVVPGESGLPWWAWVPVGAVVAAIPGAVVVKRRRRQEPEDDPRVATLMEEMAHHEELLQFLNNAAHDLANPLTPIQLQLDMLTEAADHNDPEQQRQALGLVQQNVDQLTMLVGDLRDASKLRSGRLRLFPQEHDVGKIVVDAEASLHVQAADAGISLSTVVPEVAVPARVDRGRIVQVITNLVGNAIKFTPEGGAIEVRVDVEGPMTRITVTDDGKGMSAADQQKLFQPFSQAHGDEDKAKGTGLGLFIAKGIVEAHGGSIGCRSDGPGRGSTFRVTLPLDPPGAAPGETV